MTQTQGYIPKASRSDWETPQWLFARVQAPGWDATGIELDGRDINDAIRHFSNKNKEVAA